MTRALVVLRPEPGWSATAAAARARGIEVVGHPVFESEARPWSGPHADGFDALLAGSAAVFKHGGGSLELYRSLPVQAVGEVTAAAAKASGFGVGHVGEGGLQAILDRQAGAALRYLRLCGEERVALVPHPGQDIVERAVYRMRPRPLEADLARFLAEGKVLVALHSAAAALHFTAEVDRLAIPRSRLPVLVLAPRIAEAAGAGWAAVHVADRPADAALLAKAAGLCEERL